jgi:hypothetical protein
MKGKEDILAACKEYGCETIADAVAKTRQEGMTYPEAANFLRMTRWQYNYQARRAGIFVAKKNMPKTIFEVFKSFDDRIRTDKARKLEKAKKFGYTYFSEAIHELLKENSRKYVCKALGMSSTHIDSYSERIELALVRLGVNNEKRESMDNNKKMCTCCGVRGREGRFLCNKCWQENSEDVMIYGVMQANGLVGGI